MTPEERKKEIHQRLIKAFAPSQLNVIDDSHKHVGHAGSADGAGHYTVIIAADTFIGKSRVAVHREIYQALADLIPQEIHALCIRQSQ